MAELLLEIGLEEVPARMLAAAQAELGSRVRELLERERLTGAQAALETYSTPRRLAVLVRGIEPKQPDREEQLTGPAWSIAFKGGEPTPAAHAFARKAGIAVEQIVPLATAKGEYASARVIMPGRAANELLCGLLPREIAGLSWPKPMYWRAGKPERFVRPVQWIVALLGSEVLPVEFAGVRAGRLSCGHRVLHGSAPVMINTPMDYSDALAKAHVLVDVEVRRQMIRKALDRVTRTVPGGRWREDVELVDTVTHLTEWPSVVLGRFSDAYLALPDEVLVTVMRDHQKYFALEDSSGKLLPYFLAVLNTAVDDAGEAVIRHGNERVLRARFNDAQFFWEFDRKMPLAERATLLAKVTFQKDLGTYQQKTERTLGVARNLARIVRDRGVALDEGVLDTAVELAKVDLTTELVKEFTELQGIVGGLYARAEGLEEGVAQAIYWQYMPASITDRTPPTVEGQILGLADRIGTIVDLFDLGLIPSGSKDPYALRRAANGVVKILAVSGLPLTLRELVNSTYQGAGAESLNPQSVRPFLLERLDYYLREVSRLHSDVVSAVLAAGSDDVPDAQARGAALMQVRGSDDLAAIAAAWKRIKNILRQAEEKQLPRTAGIADALLEAGAERELWRAIKQLRPAVESLRRERRYVAALEAIAALRPQVDRFFDETMVLVDDAILRANRLALLQQIMDQFGSIADFSELVPEAAQ